jgi:hypothetical protein
MKQIFIFSLVLLALTSCRKDEDEIVDGPNLNDLFGPFSIVEDIVINRTMVDFPNDGLVYYSGELSKNTDWFIYITGAETGATRTISGFDRVLSVDNAAWNGGANNFPGFGLEDCYLEVHFPNEEDAPILYDTVSVEGLKQDDGFLITSFENGSGINWGPFNQTTVVGGIVCGDDDAAKGDCHYSFAGSVPWDWAIGSIYVQPDEGNFGLPSSATNLFFNMGFRALENVGPTNSFIQFWFDEDENGDGVFDEATEDRFLYEYWSTGNEWDLISFIYGDLQFDIEGQQAETNGNGLPEPSKLLAINVFFLANTENGFSSALVDHLIFTTNSPYTP